MTWSRWLLGIVVLAATVLPPFLGAPFARRRIVPGWRGPERVLADVVIAITAVVLLCEALGTVHLLRPPVLAVGGVLVGAGLWRWGHGRADDEPAVGIAWLGSRVELGLGAAAVVALLAQSLTSVMTHLREGILDPDSLHYHLTFAARFAKSASTTGIAYVSPGDATPYHPATAELLHSIGLLSFRVEVLTLVLNLGALALALLAAAVIGGRVTHGGAAVAATATLLALPMVGREQVGSATNDAFAIAFLLAAVALVLVAGDDRRMLAIGGLAAGLAVGTKLTTAVPLVVFVLAVAVASPSIRDAWRRVAHVVLPAVLAGGYWPLRNLVHIGSPYPALDLPFLPRPPTPILDRVDQSVAHYLGDRDVIGDVFVPGLRAAVGPARYGIALLLVIAAVLLLVTRRDRLVRLLPVVALVGVAAYVVTPTTAGGPEGDPFLFRYNVRYALPALVLLAAGAVLAPTIARVASWWAGAWVAMLLLTLSSRTAWDDPNRRAVAVILAVAVVVFVVVALRWRLVLGLGVIGAVAAGGVVSRGYVDDRYAHPHGDRAELLALSRNLTDERVGVSGFPLQYPFFGPHLDGDVEYVAEVLDDDEVRDPPTCAAWRRALIAGRYDDVVVLRAEGSDEPRAAAWTRSIDGAREVFANGAGSAFVLPTEISASC